MEQSRVELSNIFNLWSKEYITGINEHGRTTTTTLNIFERVARSAFGYHAETHLKKVLSNISRTITCENFTFADGEAFKVMTLFHKIRVIGDPDNSFRRPTLHLCLKKCVDDQGRGLEFSLLYDPTKANQSWGISAKIKDETGIPKGSEAFFSIQDQALELSTLSSSDVDDVAFDKAMRDNFHQFLIHILQCSSKLEGIQIKKQSYAESLGNLLTKNDSFLQKDNGLPPFSLDFILELSKAKASS